MSSTYDAWKAAERAESLARDLTHCRTPGDLAQVSAGLQQECATLVAHLREAVRASLVAATGQREGKVRSDADTTSRAAAKAITVKSGTQRHAVLSALGEEDMTDYEIQAWTRIDQNSERPRRCELVDLGFVQATDRTKQHDGNEWRVWKATQAGLDLLVALGEKPPARPEPTTPSLF
jgi:hypothetical protein